MKPRSVPIARRWWSLALILLLVIAGSICVAIAQDADNTAYLPVVVSSTTTTQQQANAIPASDMVTQPAAETDTVLPQSVVQSAEASTPSFDRIGNFSLSGNLGVGTDTPAEAITINAGPARFRINDFRNFPDGDPAFTFFTRGTQVGALFFQDALSNQMVLRAGPNGAGGTNNLIMQQPAGNAANIPLFIAGNGNVGMGTTLPSHRLHVLTGDAVGLFESTGTQAYLRLYTIEGPNNRVEITNRPGGRFSVFTVGGGDALNVLRDGTVGIGTITPNALLTVNGSATKPGGGSWGTFSDERIKKNVMPFADGLDVLMDINPVRFQYNGLGGYDADGKEYVGVLAQEVEQIAPYMVSTVATADFADQHVYDGSALTYILVNAVQEQQTQIETLQSENTELRGKLTELEQLHNEVAELKMLVEQLAHQ